MKINVFFIKVPSIQTIRLCSFSLIGFINSLTVHALCYLICTRQHNEITAAEGSHRKN